MLFAYLFPFPLVIAKFLGNYFDIRGYGTKNTFQLVYASINLRTERLERERRRGPNKKKIREFIKTLRIPSASPLMQGAEKGKDLC